MSEENIDDFDIINEENPIPLETEDKIEEPQQQVKPESAIPEKFRGKSAEELADMYINLEKDHSRLGNELGENRKLIDSLIQKELAATPSKEPESQPDWDYEPEQAVRSLLDKEVGAIRQELDQFKQAEALDKFKADYPDYEKDISTPDFQEWVTKSKYRTDLYNKNYNGVDIDAASELLDLWNERKSYMSAGKEEEDAQRQEQLKAASMEKSTSSGGSRKKMWSRAYIRKLRMDYEAGVSKDYLKYKDEIEAAYAENRLTK